MVRNRIIDHYPQKTAVDQTFPNIYPYVLNFDKIKDILKPDI
jgi:hypothetical protein